MKGLQKYETGGTKRAEILMLLKRKEYKDKVFVLLEGSTDIKLFSKLLNGQVKLESLAGKTNVTELINAVTKDHPDRLIGICDADFDHLNHVKAKDAIYLTDTHDSETMILAAIGIDALIAEYAKENYRDGLSRNLLQQALTVAYEIGLLKWLNAQHGYDLKFDGLDFECFITIKGLQCQFSLQGFVEAVIQQSHAGNSGKNDQFIAGIEQLRCLQADPFMVCTGHDISKIMAFILKGSDCTLDNMSQSKIEEVLRLSYNKVNFAATKLYGQLVAWQQDHSKDILS